MLRFKLVFFSPIKNTSYILTHLFEKYPNHVGRIGEYEHCAFMTSGIGNVEFIYLSLSPSPWETHVCSLAFGNLKRKMKDNSNQGTVLILLLVQLANWSESKNIELRC